MGKSNNNAYGIWEMGWMGMGLVLGVGVGVGST